MTEPTRGAISRRQFLAGGAAASLSAVMVGRRERIGELLAGLAEPSTRPIGAVTTSVPVPSFTFSVARDADLALLDFEFYGFTKVVNISLPAADVVGARHIPSITKLVPSGTSNVIVVQFPPQAIAEAAYNFEKTEATWEVDPPPVLSALAGPSRLCFTLPKNKSVNFTTMTAADLLDWSEWTLLVPQPAKIGLQATAPVGSLPSGALPVPANPTLSGMLTYIEYPYGLYLSPTVSTLGADLGFTTTFAGRTDPLESSTSFVDCWTAALLQTADSNGSPIASEAAAVWARDYGAPDGDKSTPETYIYYGAT